jgi:hypothetical protein
LRAMRAAIPRPGPRLQCRRRTLEQPSISSWLRLTQVTVNTHLPTSSASSACATRVHVMLAAAGLARPKVLVSAGALIVLDDEELAAGLDHEHGHIARRHRFLLVFAELCGGIGRAVPGRRRALRELAFHLERDADHWALRRRNDRYALASAICKATGGVPMAGLAFAPLGEACAVERLGQLIEDSPPHRRRASPVLLKVIAVAMACATIVIAAFVPSTALAGAQHFGHEAHPRHCEEQTAHY